MSERVPVSCYMSKAEAQRDISFYLMDYYNWQRPHQFNDGLAPARRDISLNLGPELADHYTSVSAHDLILRNW